MDHRFAQNDREVEVTIYPWSCCVSLRRALVQRENGMALFGNCFPSRHAFMAACYRDDYATNFNLASGCK